MRGSSAAPFLVAAAIVATMTVGLFDIDSLFGELCAAALCGALLWFGWTTPGATRGPLLAWSVPVGLFVLELVGVRVLDVRLASALPEGFFAVALVAACVGFGRWVHEVNAHARKEVLAARVVTGGCYLMAIASAVAFVGPRSASGLVLALVAFCLVAPATVAWAYAFGRSMFLANLRTTAIAAPA